MAWILQPKNYHQTLLPNLYRVDYRRVGAYKGMGRGLGQVDLSNCSNPVYPNYPDTSTAYCNDLSANPLVNLPLVSPQQAAATQSIYGMPGTTGGPATAFAMYLPWIIGGVVLVALMAGGRR